MGTATTFFPFSNYACVQRAVLGYLSYDVSARLTAGDSVCALSDSSELLEPCILLAFGGGTAEKIRTVVTKCEVTMLQPTETFTYLEDSGLPG